MIQRKATTQLMLGRAVSGDMFKHNGTMFEVVNVQRYQSADGRKRIAVTLEARCVVCGDWFQVAVARAPKWIPCTCRRHRGQGPRLGATMTAGAVQGNGRVNV